MAIHVIDPGALTTVQDRGRFGYLNSGIPRSGAMDQQSYMLANQLLGNDPSCAVLECTLVGGMYRFDEDMTIALTGADMQPKINGTPVSMHTAISVNTGDILTLGYATRGCRTYLAVSGGIDVPPVLGSRSTFMKCKMGGYKGRALEKGDIIPCMAGASEAASSSSPSTPTANRAHICTPVPLQNDVTLRVILGPQAEYFTTKGIETFLSSAYLVSKQSDRMGCRMDGPAVESCSGCDMISDGILAGCIQVTSAGQPIILMADAQTTGGYAKIAVVCSEDLPLLAQCKPGSVVHFHSVQV